MLGSKENIPSSATKPKSNGKFQPMLDFFKHHPGTISSDAKRIPLYLESIKNNIAIMTRNSNIQTQELLEKKTRDNSKALKKSSPPPSGMYSGGRKSRRKRKRRKSSRKKKKRKSRRKSRRRRRKNRRRRTRRKVQHGGAGGVEMENWRPPASYGYNKAADNGFQDKIPTDSYANVTVNPPRN